LQFAKDYWQVILVFTAALSGIIVWCLLFEDSEFAQGLTIGVIGAVFVSTFVVFFLVVTGSALTLAGAWAEDFVSDELKKAVRRGHVWGFVNNIEFGASDIDHVIVAPGAVVAIETKAHVVKINRDRAQADLQQALRTAKKAASLLRSQDIEMPSEVVPVLAVWGKGVVDSLPVEGRVVSGVHVVHVSDLSHWLARFKTGRIAEDNAHQLLKRLRAFRDSRELRDPVLS
jgi:hypothetical protein